MIALFAFMISVFAFYSFTFYGVNVFILLVMSIFELYSLIFMTALFAFMVTIFAFYSLGFMN